MTKATPSNPPAIADALDRIAEGLLLLLLAFAPLAIGAVEAWSRLAVSTTAAAIAICLVGKAVLQPTRVRGTWAYVPVALFLALAVVQLVPLPAGLVRAVSPHTTATKFDLLGETPDRTTLSFYPGGAGADLRTVLAAAAVFVAVVNVYRRPEPIKRLLTGVAVIGAVVALLALGQDALGATKIYGRIGLSPGSAATAGPFVNHSHFAQFMNLSVGAMLGLLLVKAQEIARDRRGGGTLSATDAWRSDPRARVVGLLAAGVVLGLVSIALSRSRGGVIAAIIAGAFTAFVTATRLRTKDAWGRSGGQGAIVFVLLLVAFALLLYFGFEAVYERFAAGGRAVRSLDSGRWQMLKDMAGLWRAYPLTGTGLGTHEFVFPLVDTSVLGQVATHAENEYAQALEEMGAPGLAAVLAFVGIVWANYVTAIRGQRTIHAAALGLGYGLLAVCVHSLSDFGQHVPANACLSAATCGLLVALARLPRGSGVRVAGEAEPADTAVLGAARPLPTRMARPAAIALTVALAISSFVVLPGANAARRAEAYAGRAAATADDLARNDWQGSDDDYSVLIADAEDASALEPGDVRYAYNLNLYRWRAIARDLDPQGGPPDDETLGYARRVADELLAARRLCPTFGSPYTLAGQIEAFVLNRPAEGTAVVRTGYRLSPQDAAAALAMGRLEVSQDPAASLPALKRAVMLDPSLRSAATDVYLRDAGRPDLALELAGDDSAVLLALAADLDARGEFPDTAGAARARAIGQLKTRCARPDATAAEQITLAGLYETGGDPAAAVDCWRRALAADLTRTDWRIRLAQDLAAVGRRDEARREAETCLHSRPGMAEAEDLLSRLGASGEKPGVGRE